MRRRRVQVVWGLLAVLLGVVGVVEYRDALASRAARAMPDTRMLLPLPASEITALELAEAGTLHRFERDATGAWLYHGVHTGAEGTHAHAAEPAAAQHIEQAVQAFGRTRVERTLPRGTDPRTYGLTAPRLLILVYRARAGQPVAQYAVGDVAPDTTSRYVDVVGGPGVVTIPGYQVDNLLALIEKVRPRPRADGPARRARGAARATR